MDGGGQGVDAIGDVASRSPRGGHASGLRAPIGLGEGGKRAVGFKLSEGMDIPEELSSFKFARQKSKLAGTIRGSYFVIKHEHRPRVRRR